jgi:hypothetical protein
MTEDDRNDLRTAADTLAEVPEGVSDAETADRVDAFADQLRDMADADRGPDHGRLDRVMHCLREIADELDGEACEAVADARSHVRSYRETVEGV